MKTADRSGKKRIYKNLNKLYLKTSNPYVLIIFIIVILLTVWTISLIFRQNVYNLTILKAEDELFRMNQVVAEQTGSLFHEIRSYLHLLDEWLKDNPKADPRTSREFLHLVDSIKSKSRVKIDIRLVSRDGGLFYLPAKDAKKPLAFVGDREYVMAQKESATRGFYIARPVISRVSGRWGIPVSYPVTKQNAGIAVIFANIELSTLNELYEKVRPKPDGAITLSTTDGYILDRVPFNEKSMGSLIVRNEKDRKLKDGVQLTFSPLDKIEKIISVQTIQDMPLRVGVSIPKAEVLSQLNYRYVVIFAILSIMSILIVIFGFFLYKSWVTITESEQEGKILNNEMQKKNLELEEALSKVKQLNGMLPICSSCKKIRNDTGYWENIENYISMHSEAEFSHGICPDCAKRLYPDLFTKS